MAVPVTAQVRAAASFCRRCLTSAGEANPLQPGEGNGLTGSAWEQAYHDDVLEVLYHGFLSA
jgi:hypothetical protein